MGKKTNWTSSEDQTLCRAWLHAGDTIQLRGSDHKASTFWGVVHQLFHAELDTSVQRALTGLKIRWTRINRDVQKFAHVYAQVQAIAAVDATEQQCIEEARVQFLQQHKAKFTFEVCWKLLRFSPKWLQLLAAASGRSASSMIGSTGVNANSHTSPSTSTFLNAEEVAVVATAASSAPQATANGQSEQSSTIATSAAVSAAMDATARVFLPSTNERNKRRATHPPAQDYSSSDIPEVHLNNAAGSLVGEIRRHNELLEERNAISILRADPGLIVDDEARECFLLLRRRCIKRIRASTEAYDDENASDIQSTQNSDPSAGANSVHGSGKGVIQTNVV